MSADLTSLGRYWSGFALISVPSGVVGVLCGSECAVVAVSPPQPEFGDVGSAEGDGAGLLQGADAVGVSRGHPTAQEGGAQAVTQGCKRDDGDDSLPQEHRVSRRIL